MLFRFVKPRGVQATLDEEELFNPLTDLGRIGRANDFIQRFNVSAEPTKIKRHTDFSQIVDHKTENDAQSTYSNEYQTAEVALGAVHSSGMGSTVNQQEYSQFDIIWDKKGLISSTTAWFSWLFESVRDKVLALTPYTDLYQPKYSLSTSETSIYYTIYEDIPILQELQPGRRRGAFSVKMSAHQVRFPTPRSWFLPPWFLWFGWTAVFAHLVVTSVFTILYGFQVLFNVYFYKLNKKPCWILIYSTSCN